MVYEVNDFNLKKNTSQGFSNYALIAYKIVNVNVPYEFKG